MLIFYGFSSSHVQMWGLDHKEDWAPENWCLLIVILIVVLKKTPESSLDYKELKWVNRKEINPEYSLGGLTLKLKLQYFGRNEPTHWKRPWCWERLKAGGEGDDRGWDV